MLKMTREYKCIIRFEYQNYNTEQFDSSESSQKDDYSIER